MCCSRITHTHNHIHDHTAMHMSPVPLQPTRQYMLRVTLSQKIPKIYALPCFCSLRYALSVTTQHSAHSCVVALILPMVNSAVPYASQPARLPKILSEWPPIFSEFQALTRLSYLQHIVIFEHTFVHTHPVVQCLRYHCQLRTRIRHQDLARSFRLPVSWHTGN